MRIEIRKSGFERDNMVIGFLRCGYAYNGVELALVQKHDDCLVVDPIGLHVLYVFIGCDFLKLVLDENVVELALVQKLDDSVPQRVWLWTLLDSKYFTALYIGRNFLELVRISGDKGAEDEKGGEEGTTILGLGLDL